MDAYISLITVIEQQKTIFYTFEIKGKAEDIDVSYKFKFLLSSPGFGTKIKKLMLQKWGVRHEF